MSSNAKTFGLGSLRDQFQFSFASFLTKRPFWAVCLAVALIVGGRLAWTKYEDELTGQPKFRLKPENLFVTAQPEWIKSNVAQTAYRTGDLNDSSLLERGLVEQVHNAFSIQTWVHNVLEVRKSPAGVHVQLEYRRPVAMVEILYEGEPRFQPIDVEGVLLPGNEFSQKETWHYLKIAVPDPVTQGLIHGSPWPDARVQSAARLAELLRGDAERLGIYRIQQVPTGDEHDEPLFELHLVNHDRYICRRILWGRAPGGEVPGEAAAEVKLNELVAFAQAHSDWLPTGDQFSLQSFDFDIRSGKIIESSSAATTSQAIHSAKVSPLKLR